jgi:hypothetical protein
MLILAYSTTGRAARGHPPHQFYLMALQVSDGIIIGSFPHYSSIRAVQAPSFRASLLLVMEPGS